jgi:hypothetical protein
MIQPGSYSSDFQHEVVGLDHTSDRINVGTRTSQPQDFNQFQVRDDGVVECSISPSYAVVRIGSRCINTADGSAMMANAEVMKTGMKRQGSVEVFRAMTR